jgi:hypothetical protein
MTGQEVGLCMKKLSEDSSGKVFSFSLLGCLGFIIPTYRTYFIFWDIMIPFSTDRVS